MKSFIATPGNEDNDVTLTEELKHEKFNEKSIFINFHLLGENTIKAGHGACRKCKCLGFFPSGYPDGPEICIQCGHHFSQHR